MYLERDVKDSPLHPTCHGARLMQGCRLRVMASLPKHKSDRIKLLRKYAALASEPEPTLVDSCRVAAYLCGAEAAAIHLVDTGSQNCLAQTGELTLDGNLAMRVTECEIELHREEINGRFFAGVPLNYDGLVLGIFSVLGENPITPEAAQMFVLHARGAMEQIVARCRSQQPESGGDENLVGNAVEGVFQTTSDGRYLSANTMLAMIYGYESRAELMDELRDISVQLYVEPGRRDDFVRLMKGNDVITNFESQIRKRDGTVIWISENVHAVRGKTNKLLYYEGTVTDITEKRKIEEALRKSEILYHSLVENIPQNILRKDMAGKFTFANKNFCRLIGHSLEEILGKTDLDFFPADLADKYRRDDLKVIETGETCDAVEEHEAGDGGKLYVHVIKTPLFDLEDNPAGIQCMFWDVTQRKKVEEQLAFERDLLRALLENVPDRIYFKDTESRFVRCSRALANRLGLNIPEEVIGKTDYDFHPEKDAREYHEDEQRVVLTGESVVNKVERQTANDGQPIWASVTKVPFRNRAGMTTGIIGISRDITALKQAEEEMVRARDLAQESAQLKAQFLATMSHEIRTPMNAIIGMIDLLLSTDLNEQQDEYAGHVRTSADALLEILNDILDLSKIEAGQLELEKRKFNLLELVEDAVDLHALKAQEKNVELACHVPSELCGAYRGDTGRLRQVLLNYISNAVKFTEKGTVRVTAAADRNGHIRFEVCDTGIGIAQEFQPKMFEAFRQADGSTTRKYGGTGLGLAISRELVELMNGELGVESELDCGSTFWFSIPLEPTPQNSTETHEELISKKMLLAVPDGFVRRALSESASEWGLEVNSVADGSAAIRQLENPEVPDLVLLDLDLPGVDVLDLVQTAHDRFPNARVLLLTTRTRKFDPAIIRAMGVSGTLTKPVKCRRLASALVEALVGKKSSPAEISTAAVHRVPRVLVIEDNLINQRVAQLQLEKLGCQVYLRDRGEAVLEEKLDDYDMIFMDCQMPGMDGLEATRRIREMQKDKEKNTHIIAMTANAREADRQACLDAGMNDFISKPIEIEELQRVVNQALDKAIVMETNVVGAALPAETLREILPLYLKQAREQVAAMETSVSTGDNEFIRRTAHQLKGSSANVGAQAMADLCARVEELAENGGTGLELLLPDLSHQLEIAEGLLSRQAGL